MIILNASRRDSRNHLLRHEMTLTLMFFIILSRKSKKSISINKFRTHIFLCFEILFRRLKTDTIKTLVHKRVYGNESQGNELTKFLIQSCVAAKKGPIEGFILHTAASIETDFKTLNSPA